MQQRQVRDLMRIRHGHVVSDAATLREVAERLIVSDCDVMAITDSQGKLSGIVCESSVVRALMANPAESATIQSIVSRHAESVRIDACLNSVLPLFRSSANTAIPVIDESGRVCGLLMRRDVIGSLLHRRVDASETDGVMSDELAKTTVSSASMIRPPFSKRVLDVPQESGETNNRNTAGLQKPHFMRAEEARRFLWAAEDRL